jgi:hypothetical protein
MISTSGWRSTDTVGFKGGYVLQEPRKVLLLSRDALVTQFNGRECFLDWRLVL